jgi:hypothetical protein
MRRTALVVLIIGLVGSLGISFEAWAGGNAPPPSCQVDKKPGGAKIHGLVAMTVYNYDGSSGDVDATLHLRFQGKEDVFRAHVFANLLSPEDLLCQVLAVNPTNRDGQTIQQAFKIHSNKTLVITGPPLHPESSVEETNFDVIPGGPTGDASALARVTIFVK